jgi:hypothetical protein
MRQPIAVLTVLALLSATPSYSQPPAPAAGRVIRLNGSIAASTAAGTPEPVRFAIYDEASGGTLLWEETHTLRLDAAGQYSVLLGTGSPDGLPADLFAADAARWLAVERAGVAAAPRTLLTAVPYAVAAVTAADAASLGGRPAADYALTAEARRRDGGTSSENVGTATAADSRTPVPLVNNGTTGYLGKFLNTQDLDSSALFQTGAGRLGLGTTTPFDMFQSTFTNTTGTMTGYAVQNLGNSATAYSGMLFYDHTGALRQFQGYNNSTGEYRINNISPTASINFMLGGDSKFRVAGDGRISLGGGSLSPEVKLHLFGTSYQDRTIRGMAFSGSLTAPTAPTANVILASLEGAGYNGTFFTQARGFIDIRTAQPWTTSGTGSAIVFATTANGSNSATERATIAENGYVGIGTLTPEVPLDISGSTTLTNSGVFSLFSAGSTGLATSTNSNISSVSIRGSGWLVGAGIAAVSDARIKTVVGRSDAARDLDLLSRIEVTNYTHIDRLEKGGGLQKKVVAQQVEQVFPQAVSQMTDVVPDIFKPAAMADGWVVLDTDLAVGDRIRLITDKGHRAVHTVTAVAPGRFRTDFAGDGGRLFVYGREVRDFRVVDYEAIAMLNVSATQELHRRLDAQTSETATLRQELADLRAALATALDALHAARVRR